MSNTGTCPICDYALDQSAVTVTVGGVRHRVCCAECAREAVANPAKQAPRPAPAGKK